MDLKHILKLNLELEADIRLHMLRDNDETKQILIDKFNDLSEAISEYIGIEMPVSASIQTPEDTDDDLSMPDGDDDADDSVLVTDTTDDAQDSHITAGSIMTEKQNIAVMTADDGVNPVQQPYHGTIDITDNNVNASVTAPAAANKSQSSNLMKSFTINDKFRFMRGIFDNDKDEFESTIAYIDNLGTLDQAYDYLLNELGWDIDNEDVADFISVIANHFNNV